MAISLVFIIENHNNWPKRDKTWVFRERQAAAKRDKTRICTWCQVCA